MLAARFKNKLQNVLLGDSAAQFQLPYEGLPILRTEGVFPEARKYRWSYPLSSEGQQPPTQTFVYEFSLGRWLPHHQAKYLASLNKTWGIGHILRTTLIVRNLVPTEK